MNDLAVAALVLVGAHFGISSTPLRAQLVASVGERVYRALFSLIAIVTLVWLIVAYRAADRVALWNADGWLAWLLLMPVALFLLVTSLTSANPTAVGQSIDPDAAQPATGILRVTRHPFMWATGIWALTHLLAAGDSASLIFFGAIGTLALVGTVLIDVKRSRENAPGWGVFLQRTSNLPLRAAIEGRQRVIWREFSRMQLGITVALYIVLVLAHPWLFGVKVWPF